MNQHLELGQQTGAPAETDLSVKVALEVDVDLQDSSVKAAPKSSLVTVFPFLVHNRKRKIFVWGTRREEQDTGVVVALGFDKLVRGCLGLVDEIWIENVEFVALYDLGRRIVRTVAQQMSVSRAQNNAAVTYS